MFPSLANAERHSLLSARTTSKGSSDLHADPRTRVVISLAQTRLPVPYKHEEDWDAHLLCLPPHPRGVWLQVPLKLHIVRSDVPLPRSVPATPVTSVPDIA
eukprot:3355281-Rhodomonas_salina.1